MISLRDIAKKQRWRLAAWLIVAGGAFLFFITHANVRVTDASDRKRVCYYVDDKTQDQISATTFLDIFRQARTLSCSPRIVLTKPATTFLKTCCATRDEAVQLLRDNGFTISFYKPEHKPYVHVTEYGREEFDDAFVAKRGEWWSPFLTYRATVLIKHNHVEVVIAHRFWSLPLP
jgi:hypothetical protein